MKKHTAAAAIVAAALTLTACGTTDATTTPPAPVTVTTTATPTTPTGTLRDQFKANGLMVIGLDNATIKEAGTAACEARDAGVSHTYIMNIGMEGLSEFYTPDELETIISIWYENLCPQHA